MVKKSSDFVDGPVTMKIKSGGDYCLPQTLRVELVNDRIHIIVTNTGQGWWHLFKSETIGVVDFRSEGYFHITRDGIKIPSFIYLNEGGLQVYMIHMQVITKHYKWTQELTYEKHPFMKNIKPQENTKLYT